MRGPRVPVGRYQVARKDAGEGYIHQASPGRLPGLLEVLLLLHRA